MGVAILPHRVLQQGAKLPEYTYTGSHQLIDDGDGNWRIKFLTSGTLTLKKAADVDIFCVGGGGAGGSATLRYTYYDEDSGTNKTDYSQAWRGGGGGGGGKTATLKAQSLAGGTAYSVVVGSGGAPTAYTSYNTYYYGGSGGTSGFGLRASAERLVSAYGGDYGYYAGDVGSSYPNGGNGGSGGSGYAGNGGSNGGNGGGQNSVNFGRYGRGQGTTTREFGEASGALYAGGGGCGVTPEGGADYSARGYGGSGGGGDGASSANAAGSSGSANTGGGGGGTGGHATLYAANDGKPGSGGSGIVIIRNAR